MRTLNTIQATFLILLFLHNHHSIAQVGINTSGSNPHASAMLDINSNSKGLLIPSMSTAQRDAISNPADGLMIFNTTNGIFYYYDAAKMTWQEFYSPLNSIWTKEDGSDDILVRDVNDDNVVIGSVLTDLARLYVRGKNNTQPAIYGYSDTHYGIYGYSSNSTAGVYAETFSGFAALYATANQGHGMYARTSNTASRFAGYFAGDVFTTGAYLPSYSKLKQNAENLKGAMTILQQLKPKTYQYKTEEYKSMNLPEGQRYGLMAEELEAVLPQLVKDTDTQLHDWDTYYKAQEAAKAADEPMLTKPELIKEVEFKAVNYTELIPIMIAAMQEQQATIEAMQQQIDALKAN